MSVFSGDFLGFQLGNIHSSTLNITRVSNSDRYTETLTPNFTDQVVQRPGADGTYYWNTFYTQKPFSIDFAFDDLRDEDIKRLRRIFGFKGVKELIFDEEPYKKYYVKCSSPPTLKYIAFPYEGVKVYKGEGSANLVAYYPYALSVRETTIGSGTNINLTNSGDIETPIKIYYAVSTTAKTIQLTLKDNDNITIGQLVLTSVKRIGTDSYICVDNKTHLVEGLDVSFNKTGNLYNKYITSGDFFNLPLGQTNLISSTSWNSIKFNYLYY